MKYHKQLIMGVFLVLLYGCGGGGGDGGDGGDSSNPAPKTGVFLDSPVINIGYRTATQVGVTSVLGEYNYLQGETVTFFIGALEFAPTQATGVLTPLEIAGTQDINNPAVINMIRLLQTLDQDGNPDNGITITETAKTAATQVNFGLSELDFESSSAVLNLITNAGQDNATTQLVGTADAIAHFEQTLAADFSINMVGKTLNSVITYSSCPQVPLGWSYTFTNTSMTLTGSDGWKTPECTTSPVESITVNITDLASDYDIPFNCASYPTCTSSDFNKTLTGIDDDGRRFSSIYKYDRANSKLTYEKTVERIGFSEVDIFTEVIIIQ